MSQDDERFVTHKEFRVYVDANEGEHKRIMDALWGTRGEDSNGDTEGMVRDIQEIKDRTTQYWKVVGVIGGIITPIVTAILIRFFMAL